MPGTALPIDKTSSSIWSGLKQRSFAPVDIASLVYFRIAFSAVMLWEVWRYFSHDWISRYWIEPTFQFTYWGFGWVQPWPGEGMYLHFYALGLLAVLMGLGLFYRVSATLFFLAFTYMFLLEKARYLNHFYLICLLSFLLIFIPTHRSFSLDAWRRPGTRSDTAPCWALWLLRAQIGIVYLYGGVAKLNQDWLGGEPMRDWLGSRTDFPVMGSYFTEEWMVYLFSYGGLLLDLLGVPLLLWKRTRIFAFVLVIGFHVTNAGLFNIGIFPWFMIAATTIFFHPGWPRRAVGFSRPLESNFRADFATRQLGLRETITLSLVGVYLAIQVLMPLRHFLYSGNVNWTEEGHNFSWHMKLRDKDGRVRFHVADPAMPESWRVNPRDYLERWQVRKMATRPDLILQFSHFLADEFGKQGPVEVRAVANASLNGRKRQLLINPEVDLTLVERSLAPARWILPLADDDGETSPGGGNLVGRYFRF